MSPKFSSDGHLAWWPQPSAYECVCVCVCEQVNVTSVEKGCEWSVDWKSTVESPFKILTYCTFKLFHGCIWALMARVKVMHLV